MWEADACLIAGALLVIVGVFWLAGLGWAAIAGGLLLILTGTRAHRNAWTQKGRGHGDA